LHVVRVTERAAEELRRRLLAETSDPEVGVRLLPAPGGTFVLILGTELSGDEVVEYQGSKVLLIGIEYTRAFGSLTVDCYDAPEGVSLFARRQ
jgi:hypothetical protein